MGVNVGRQQEWRGNPLFHRDGMILNGGFCFHLSRPVECFFFDPRSILEILADRNVLAPFQNPIPEGLLLRVLVD